MKGRTSITLGENDKDRRFAALTDLAQAVGAIGRNTEPSISELICLIADAFDENPAAISDKIDEIINYTRPIVEKKKTEDKMNGYEYWNHKSSGETYAVQIVDGKPVYMCGPLHYKEVEANDPSDYNFDDPFEESPDDYILTPDIPDMVGYLNE